MDPRAHWEGMYPRSRCSVSLVVMCTPVKVVFFLSQHQRTGAGVDASASAERACAYTFLCVAVLYASRIKKHAVASSLETPAKLTSSVSVPFSFSLGASHVPGRSRVVVTRALSTPVQVLLVTGIVLAICTLGIFPRLIKMMGIVTWQRIGCLLGVPIFLAVPNAKFLSWNESSLFVVSALTNFLAFYSITTVRGTRPSRA